MALVGDSHAPAWRAAVAVAARGKRWHAITIHRNSCPFSLAPHPATDQRRVTCARWVRQTINWFARHPEVATVFVANSAFYEMAALPGGDGFTAAVAGFRDAFAALPPSVRRIVVLRDSPRADITTLDCVAGVVRRHQRPDLRCALQRSSALVPDPAAQAAAEGDSPRAQVIDLTPHFCDDALCYPVVGGLLVYKDPSHLVAPFAASLGPFLLAAYDRLAPPPGVRSP